MSARIPAWREAGPARIVRERDPAGADGETGRDRALAGDQHPGGHRHPGIADIERAAARIAPYTVRTPVARLEIEGLEAFAKLEARQRTGSFKARGAANRLLTLDPDVRAGGVVTASSGNHGRAVAELARELGIPATVCVPRSVDSVKLEAIRASGATISAEAPTYDEAELTAERLASERRLTFVHPFDDPDVIAGQGTVGLELAEQVDALDAVLVPLSGGGLCAGIALAFAQRSPTTRLIGVSARHAAVLHHCLLAGRPIVVPEQPTFASALSGGLGERNLHSLAIVGALLDEAWLVDEQEIARAMIWGERQLGVAIEGGGAVALAALLRDDASDALREAGAGVTGTPPRVAAIVSGGNVEQRTLSRAQALAS